MRYQIGGSLRSDDPTYVTRQADERLYASLKAGNFCYVFNSRQMGKSSLLQRTSYRLRQEGHSCVFLDMTRLGIEDTTPDQWYKGIIISLFYSLNLAEQVNYLRYKNLQRVPFCAYLGGYSIGVDRRFVPPSAAYGYKPYTAKVTEIDMRFKRDACGGRSHRKKISCTNIFLAQRQ